MAMSQLYAKNAFTSILTIFQKCVLTEIPKQKFLMDNLKRYVNYPSKTTIGIAPKFTSNRKFLANMIASQAFKQMLTADLEEVRNSYVKKMQFCDGVAMDQNSLRELYDRETDPAKL